MDLYQLLRTIMAVGEVDQAFKKEVSNYERELLICTWGIKDTIYDYMNFNGIFYMAY